VQLTYWPTRDAGYALIKMRVTIDNRKCAELSGIALARCIPQDVAGVHRLLPNK
jgi:hypothetical protein